MPYDKSKPYSCPCCGYWNGDMKYDYYKHEKPLIKDEKKLDTVKSFFALLGITKEIYYQTINNCFYHTDDDGISYGIDFSDDKGFDNIDTNIAYTIDELCGEEEE